MRLRSTAARILVIAVAFGTTPFVADAAGEIPVFCTTGAGVGFEQVLTCRRAETRASFSSVPDGMFLHVTDVSITRNNVATTGSFAALIGRDDAGAFPTYPNLDLTGRPIGVHALHFRAPHIVLRAGESLAIANFAESDFSVDVYVSGFLAPSVRVPEPSLLLTTGAALATLGAMQRSRRGSKGASPTTIRPTARLRRIGIPSCVLGKIR